MPGGAKDRNADERTPTGERDVVKSTVVAGERFIKVPEGFVMVSGS